MRTPGVAERAPVAVFLDEGRESAAGHLVPGAEKLGHPVISTREFERPKAGVPPEERTRRELRVVRKPPQDALALPRARCAAQDRPGVAILAELRPAGPVEERLADSGLEAGDLLADGRLRVAQDVGRADEGPLLGHRAQGPQVPQLHIVECHKYKHK